jgi:dihydroorotate dehydrogenase
VGPITNEGSDAAHFARDIAHQAIYFANPPANLSLATVQTRLMECAHLKVPILVRLGLNQSTEAEITRGFQQIIPLFAPHAAAFSIPTLRVAIEHNWTQNVWRQHLQEIFNSTHKPILLCVSADVSTQQTAPFIETALQTGFAGLLQDGTISQQEQIVVGAPTSEAALQQLRDLRERWPEIFIIGSGGIHEPERALEFLAEGADLVQVDSGLVYSGPGLPKRINEAILFQQAPESSLSSMEESEERAPEMTWFWTALLGAGMLFGSVLTLLIAMTRIVLPYDEAFVGLSRDEMLALNPRLLDFMAHDRVTLAGTMVSLGLLYLSLSLFAVRRGMHWAQQSIFWSAFIGFASFFGFLGFGYLDPFHAFVSACLLQFLLLGVHSKLGIYQTTVAPHLRETRAWRRSLWGQLLLILHSVALLAAGLLISFVGVTQVFVPEDLEFLQTTRDALQAANPRIVPLVAHDRATLGGMLLSCGLIFLLPALWGFRNGERWLWWTLLIAGIFPYASTIAVHGAVTYISLKHLLPAFAGLGLFLLSMALSYSYLCNKTAD